MNIHDYINIGELIGAITTIIAGALAVYKFVLRPLFKMFRQIALLMNSVEMIVADLKPNGGSSLKDQINRIENKLIRGEMRSKALIRDYDCGIFECDIEGNNSYVNRTYCRVLNVPSSELLGKSWAKYMSSNSNHDYNYRWKEKFSNCEEVDMTMTFTTSNGDDIEARVKAYPLKDDGSTKCIGYFGMVFFEDDTQ